jgi:glucan 1,3-beta-glucosidase
MLTLILDSYFEAHRMIREITGIGAGNGPYIAIHDMFREFCLATNLLNAPLFSPLPGMGLWAGFLSGSDRVALEPHPYFAFDGAGATDIVPYLTRPCEDWGASFNRSQTGFGVTAAGEWSLAFNDCESRVQAVRNGSLTEWP